MSARVLILVSSLGVLGLGLATRARAAAPPTAAPAAGETTSPTPGKAKATGEEPEAKGKEARVDDGKAGRPSTKTRAGSMLKKEETPRPVIDLRGEAERRRDAELIKHFTRIAELDVIAEIGLREGDLALIEKVENVRRKELRRHRDVLQRLRQVSLIKAWQGKP